MMLRYYLIDLAIYILLFLICFFVIFYNMDIILYSLLLSNINNYFVSMIDNYDYQLMLDEVVKYSETLDKSKLDSYYSISNININTTLNSLDSTYFIIFISILLTMPYALYLITLYLMPFGNTLFRLYAYALQLLLFILHYSYIYIYTIYIYPVILNYDWDHIFDSDISNYMPYGIELVYVLNTNTLLIVYVIGYISNLLITYLYIYCNIYKYVFIKFIVIIISLLLLDYKCMYIICIGEFIYIICLTIKHYK